MAGLAGTRRGDPAPADHRLRARHRDASRPQAAIAADDAGDDLRRGGGRLDDVDRRGSAARGAHAHRAARRAQPDRRGARGDRLPGLPESAEDLAGPDRARSAGHPRECARHHRSTARKRLRPTEARAETAARDAAGLRRRARLPQHRRAAGRVRDASSTRRKPSVAAPVCVLGEARARPSSARATRSAST